MTYDHTQRAPLYLIVLGSAGLLIVLLGLAGSPPQPALAILLGTAAVLTFLAFSFMYLRVRDEGDCLAIRFGPLPVFRRRIRYSQITGAGPGRSWFIEGWGIHYMPGRGLIYNLWGFDCVVVHLGGKAVRIGTDDPAGLAEFLRSKIGQSADGV